MNRLCKTFDPTVKAKAPEQKMLLEDILEPAQMHSSRKDSVSKVDQDSMLALGVQQKTPIIERLELPASSDSEGENPRKASSDPGLNKLFT